jgi:hypothetical protein
MYSILQSALLLCCILFIATGCNNIAGTENSSSSATENFHSEKINGKYTLDRSTSEELKVMENTVVNFSLMIKKQPTNLAAYNEYGNLLANHVDRVTKYCGLDASAKTELCNNLNLISEKIPLLQQNDVAAAAQATNEINTLFAKIDSSFAFRN